MMTACLLGDGDNPAQRRWSGVSGQPQMQVEVKGRRCVPTATCDRSGTRERSEVNWIVER